MRLLASKAVYCPRLCSTVLMDLYLKIAFDPGASYRLGDEVESWLKEAGFIETKQIPLPTQYALMIAKKP